MKKVLYIFCLCASFFLGSKFTFGQFSAYSFSTPAGGFSYVTGYTTVTLTGNTDDGWANGIPIGFTFNYDGVNYTTTNVCTDGFISFTTLTGSWPANTSSGSVATGTNRPAICPLWDDLLVTDIRYVTTGSAPNRVFTIEFNNVKWDFLAAGPVMTFQIKLYETSNNIDFVYQQEANTVSTSGGGCSIGLSAAASGTYWSVPNSGASPVPTYNSSDVSNITTKPASGQIYRWSQCAAASISVQPSSQSKCIGSSVTFAVTASGTGLSYQWRKNGTNIGGATSSSYTIGSVVAGDAANYDVVITGTCGNATSSAATLTVNTASVLGSISNAGPIDFCNSGGDWTAAGPISVSGHNGTITWDWGSSNGTWNTGWTTGTQPGYCCFPSKVSASDANADRIRWSVKNGACAATAYSATILLKNHYNAAPSSLASSINNTCAGTAGTLTATFPSATDILGNVEFSTTCGGAAFATVAGNGTTTVATAFTAPASTTTYYARYNPGTGTGCSASSCVNTTVTIVSAAPSTPVASAASGITTSGFTANWAAATGAAGYYLDVSTNSSFSSFVAGYNNLSVGNVTSYAVAGLGCGTPYYYRVRANNCVGTSSSSGIITVTTSNCTINQPLSGSATYTVCGASYYDNGGSAGNYTGSSVSSTVTFYPSTPGSKISIAFSSFDVETHPTCGYDYMRIYDGNSTSATLLGTWCNQTGSPGTITSTSSDGSLTVLFYIDPATWGTGWAATVSCCSPAGNQTSYGSNSWIGYVYKWSGSAGTPLTTTNYLGYVTEAITFDRNVGTGSVSGATTSLCGTPTDNFSVRYMMNINFPSGNYIFTITADDGVRFSVDGGATWLINSWVDQSATFTSSCLALAGPTNLVLEYYENGSSSDIAFSYKPSPFAPSSITATPFNAIACSGSSTTLTANGSLAAYYPFSSNTNDASGNGLDLTGSGGSFTGGGIQLTNTSSYASAITGLLNTDQYTIDFYMQYTSASDGSWHKIFGFEPSGTDRSPGVWRYPSSMQMHWRHDPGNTGLAEAQTYTQGQWYHIVVEKNGATLTKYVDGTLAEQGAVANPKTSGTAALWFGGANVLLKEFKVYSGIFRWYTASCGGTLVGSGPTIVVAPASTTVYYLRAEGGCISSCTSTTINMDNTAPSHDGISTSSSCWVCDNVNTYTITATSTESGTGFGGSYGVMALVNYQGSNAGNYGGYFSWHPTSYVWTLDQVAVTGGGFASKYAGYGNAAVTLVSASTSVSGNTRTVNFVVRPNTTFPVALDNDISMYTSDLCNNQAGWTCFQTNFSSVLTPGTPGAISGTAAQCPSLTSQVYSIAAVANVTSYNWTVPTGWIITGGAGTNSITVTTGAAGQNGNITVTGSNACLTTAASSLAVTVTAPSTPVAGPDQYICSGVTTATMAASGTGTWTQVTAFAGTITTPTSATTTITGLASGKTYVFRWSAGSCSSVSYDDVVIVTQ